jgi:hypothetical protein
MKSIVALLLLVAVCQADIVKDGGLKGSWTDAIEITSTLRAQTYTVGYDGDDDAWTYDTTSEGVNPDNITETYAFNYLTFAIGGDSLDSFYYGDGGVEVSISTGTGDDMLTVDGTCTISSDNSVSCYFALYPGLGTGVWLPSFTVWDAQGNMAMYDSTVFTDTDRPIAWSVVDATPDTVAPTLGTPTVSAATATLPISGGDDYNDVLYIDVEVDVTDAGSVGSYYSSYVGVGVMVDVTLPTGSDDETYTMNLIYQESEGDVHTFGARLVLTPYAPIGTYRFATWTAWDNAQNMVEATSTLTTVVSWDSDADDSVTSCQTFEVLESSDFDATGGSATIYWSAGCTTKYSGYNYVYASIQSPLYTPIGVPAGSTEEMSLVFGSYAYYGYSGNYLTTTDLDTTTYLGNPGSTFITVDSVATGAAYIYVEDGNPGLTTGEGEYSLYELITFTGLGGVQRYNVEQGAASSVVPSLAAVAFALVALFRL